MSMKKILILVLLVSLLLMMSGCSYFYVESGSESESGQAEQTEMQSSEEEEPTEYGNFDSLESIVQWLQQDTESFCAIMSSFAMDMSTYEDVERLAEQLREEVIIPASDDLEKGLISGITDQEAQEILDTLQLVDDKVTESLEFCEDIDSYEGYEFDPTKSFQDELYMLVGLEIE